MDDAVSVIELGKYILIKENPVTLCDGAFSCMFSENKD